MLRNPSNFTQHAFRVRRTKYIKTNIWASELSPSNGLNSFKKSTHLGLQEGRQEFNCPPPDIIVNKPIIIACIYIFKKDLSDLHSAYLASILETSRNSSSSQNPPNKTESPRSKIIRQKISDIRGNQKIFTVASLQVLITRTV